MEAPTPDTLQYEHTDYREYYRLKSQLKCSKGIKNEQENVLQLPILYNSVYYSTVKPH
jgi:hypothetical protein